MESRIKMIEVDALAREVRLNGRSVTLGARAFDLLLALAQRQGRVVSKEELLTVVWPTTVVEEANLRVWISAIRKCLGPAAISTIPGRGYQLTVPVSHPGKRCDPPVDVGRTALLIGRDGFIEKIQRAFAHSRIVTLIGASGSGKTALGRRVLDQARLASNVEVRWIDLAPLNRGDLIVPTIARAFELTLPSSPEIDALAAHLDSQPTLLIIDNAEHLLEAVAQLVHTLMQRSALLKLLVTSQAKLDLADETVLAVPPLELAPPDAPPLVAQEYAAPALFIYRCEQAGHPLQRDASTLAAVADICRRLDGLPLAIEYAASLAPIVGLDGVREALDERLLSLATGRRDLPERQRSLRATLQWSYGLLNELEQVTFRRLGIFLGSCSLNLFREVVAFDSAEPWRSVDALSELIDRSLVVLEPGPVPRYRLLETARAFANELLATCDELLPLQARHADCVTARFEELHQQWLGGNQTTHETIEQLLIDIDNARAAFEWAVSHDNVLALRLCVPMTFALNHSGAWSEAGRCFALTEPFAQQDLPQPIRAGWALSAAQHWTMRDRERALRWTAFARTAYRELHDARGLFMTLARQAECLFQGDHDVASERALLAELEQHNSPAWPAPVRSAGTVAIWKLYSRVDASKALQSFPNTLAVVEDCPRNGAVLRCNVMELQNQAKLYGEAVALGESLRATLHGTRHQALLIFALANLTHAYMSLEKWDAAWRATEEGVRLALRHESLHIWTTLLAVFACRQGRHDEGALLLGFADNGYHTRGHRRGDMEQSFHVNAASACRQALGETRFDRGRQQGATADADAIMRLFDRLA